MSELLWARVPKTSAAVTVAVTKVGEAEQKKAGEYGSHLNRECGEVCVWANDLCIGFVVLLQRYTRVLVSFSRRSRDEGSLERHVWVRSQALSVTFLVILSRTRRPSDILHLRGSQRSPVVNLVNQGAAIIFQIGVATIG